MSGVMEAASSLRITMNHSQGGGRRNSSLGLPPFLSANRFRPLTRRRHSVRKPGLDAARASLDLPSLSAQEPGVSWQVITGAIFGVTPFVVAGIEFSKRILAQRKCKVCGGSGLVKRDEYYFRCYKCGGFLPWQSWRRFFTGK